MLFQDNFNRADENLNANANWTQFDGTAGWGAVRSNGLACTTSDSAGAAYWCPDTFSTRHYVQAKLTNVTIDSGPFLCVRLQDRNNFVGIRYFGLPTAGLEMYRRNAGTLTSMGIVGITAALNDVFRLEVDAGDWRILKNGVVVANGNSPTIATMLSTRCGVVMRAFVSNPWVDDFEAGDLPVMGKFPASPSSGQVYAPGAGKPGWVWNGSVWLRQPAIIGSPTAGYRNVVINGSMAIWQRNNLSAAAGGRLGPIDRYYVIGTGSTISCTVAAMPPGIVVGREAYYYQQIGVASVAGVNNCAYAMTRIEGVRQLAGKRCTVSFCAFASAALPIAVAVLQYFGTGGSPSANVNVPIAKTPALNSVGFDKRYVYSFDMPSIAGKTIGTNNDDFIELEFWFDAGANHNAYTGSLGQQSGTFYLAQIQLEEGPVATPFEKRPWHAEYQMCQRYYQTGSQYVGGPCPSTGGYAEYFTQVFKTTMRAIPTTVHSVSGYSNATTYNPLSNTVDSTGIQLVGAALGNMQCNWSWTASAEL